MDADPHRVYRSLRESEPVYHSAAAGGWLVTTYDLVEEVLTDPTRFSSAGAEIEFIDRLGDGSADRTATLRRHFATPQLNTSDPPDHTRIRRAFGRSFLNRSVAGYAETIASAADEILDAKCPAGDAMDVVADYAEPLPLRVISEIIGVPESHRARIPVVTMHQRHFFGSVDPHDSHATRFDATLREWHGLLAGWIEERKHNPTNDVMTRAAEVVDSGAITSDEAGATLLHFIIAGNGTTTALIGTVVFALLTHPEQLAAVVDDPDLIDNCIEETLRWEAPLPRDRRITVADTILGGVEIKAGERIYAVLAAANRDPAHVEDPDAFNIHRTFSAKHHATFGRGIHFCLGAPVARLEAAIALRRLLAHMPQARLSDGFEPVWHDIATHRGLVTLPIEAAQ
jgi:cytochrome P450